MGFSRPKPSRIQEQLRADGPEALNSGKEAPDRGPFKGVRRHVLAGDGHACQRSDEYCCGHQNALYPVAGSQCGDEEHEEVNERGRQEIGGRCKGYAPGDVAPGAALERAGAFSAEGLQVVAVLQLQNQATHAIKLAFKPAPST